MASACYRQGQDRLCEELGIFLANAIDLMKPKELKELKELKEQKKSMNHLYQGGQRMFVYH